MDGARRQLQVTGRRRRVRGVDGVCARASGTEPRINDATQKDEKGNRRREITESRKQSQGVEAGGRLEDRPQPRQRGKIVQWQTMTARAHYALASATLSSSPPTTSFDVELRAPPLGAICTDVESDEAASCSLRALSSLRWVYQNTPPIVMRMPAALRTLRGRPKSTKSLTRMKHVLKCPSVL